MTTPLICVVGGDGAIGSALARRLRVGGIEVLASTRRELADPERQFRLDLRDVGDARLPDCDVVILTAAMTRLADCRADPEMAWRVNVEAQIGLAEKARNSGAFVVFFSTNQVFDGAKANVDPDTAPNPRSLYGRMKAEAEAALLRSGAPTAIIRLTKVISRDLPLFEKWRCSLSKGEAIEAFDDLIMAPVALGKVVMGVEAIALKRAPGIWHLGGRQEISYFDAGRHLAIKLGADPALVRRKSAAADIPEEERPPHAGLALGNIETVAGVEISDARTEIDIGLELPE
jgi:dTDP-4-dehydrorhamnose reductase